MTEAEEALLDAEMDEAERLREEGRGRCPYCGCGYMLRKDGKVRKHSIKGTKRHCGGGEHYPS